VTTTKVTVLDYGMANLLNVARALEHCGADVTTTESAAAAARASRLVVPGVGAFKHALDELRTRGLDDAIRAFAESGKPLFGICVGMQMLFDASEEFGENCGLGVLPGRVRAIPRETVAGEPQRVPHIGWNHLVQSEICRDWSGSLLRAFRGQAPAFYFVHSFAAQPARSEDRLADCFYGGHRICAAVQRNNVVATQFHPERSGPTGLSLLQEFLSW
jgi:glutamine amidotransferase